MLTKDQSITTQVAFKAAVDIAVAAGGDLNTILSNASIAFDATKSMLDDAHGWDAAAAITDTFPGTQQVNIPAPTSMLRIAGQQHGPLPEWLVAEAAAAGVSEVWDNRDKLTQNPKRPWFKAVNSEKAFWPPKGR